MTKQTSEARLEAIRQAHAAATGRFTGADWSHELVRGGRVVTQTVGRVPDPDDDADVEGRPSYDPPREEPIYCDSCDDCEVCADAKSDARACEQYALDAIRAAERGDWAEAVELARDCAGFEREGGDCPTWGPFRDAVDVAAADAEAEDEDEDEDADGRTVDLAECECDCGCAEQATTTDDGGNRVCAACADYAVDEDGVTTYCSRCPEYVDDGEWTGGGMHGCGTAWVSRPRVVRPGRD